MPYMALEHLDDLEDGVFDGPTHGLEHQLALVTGFLISLIDTSEA